MDLLTGTHRLALIYVRRDSFGSNADNSETASGSVLHPIDTGTSLGGSTLTPSSPADDEIREAIDEWEVEDFKKLFQADLDECEVSLACVFDRSHVIRL